MPGEIKSKKYRAPFAPKYYSRGRKFVSLTQASAVLWPLTHWFGSKRWWTELPCFDYTTLTLTKIHTHWIFEPSQERIQKGGTAVLQGFVTVVWNWCNSGVESTKDLWFCQNIRECFSVPAAPKKVAFSGEKSPQSSSKCNKKIQEFYGFLSIKGLNPRRLMALSSVGCL